MNSHMEIFLLIILFTSIIPAQQSSSLEVKTNENGEGEHDESDLGNDNISNKREKIFFGDQILTNVWEFVTHMASEVDKLEASLVRLEEDLKVSAYNLLEKRIEPSIKLLKYGGSCDPDVSIKLEHYIDHQKSSIMYCRRMGDVKHKFVHISQSFKELLDDFNIKISREVSQCEYLNQKNKLICFEEIFERLQDDKTEFITKEFANIEKQVAEASDEIESFWLGCTIKALGDVKNANEILEKKLKCCQKNIYRSPCNNLQNIFSTALVFKPLNNVSDMDAYYLQVKGFGI